MQRMKELIFGIKNSRKIAHNTYSRHDSKLENLKATTCSRKFNHMHMVQELERPPLPIVVSIKFRRKNKGIYIQVSNLQECKIRFETTGKNRARK